MWSTSRGKDISTPTRRNARLWGSRYVVKLALAFELRGCSTQICLGGLLSCVLQDIAKGIAEHPDMEFVRDVIEKRRRKLSSN